MLAARRDEAKQDRTTPPCIRVRHEQHKGQRSRSRLAALKVAVTLLGLWLLHASGRSGEPRCC